MPLVRWDQASDPVCKARHFLILGCHRCHRGFLGFGWSCLWGNCLPGTIWRWLLAIHRNWAICDNHTAAGRTKGKLHPLHFLHWIFFLETWIFCIFFVIGTGVVNRIFGHWLGNHGQPAFLVKWFIFQPLRLGISKCQNRILVPNSYSPTLNSKNLAP